MVRDVAAVEEAIGDELDYVTGERRPVAAWMFWPAALAADDWRGQGGIFALPSHQRIPPIDERLESTIHLIHDTRSIAILDRFHNRRETDPSTTWIHEHAYGLFLAMLLSSVLLCNSTRQCQSCIRIYSKKNGRKTKEI
jgi:hypothetical protein